MQKHSSYFEGKLGLLHKLNGLESLYEVYKKNNKCGQVVKCPRRHFKFNTRSQVAKMFSKGEPISCFCLDNNYHDIHVEISIGDCLDMKKGDDDFAYLTFTYNIHDLFQYETGIHFCKFSLKDEVTTAKKKVLNFTDYALMLPYLNDDIFWEQYTLIYDDWEVLRCGRDEVKGQTRLCKYLYDDLINVRVY